MTHFPIEYDEATFKELPFFYVVTVTEDVNKKRIPRAAFAMKSTINHNTDFKELRAVINNFMNSHDLLRSFSIGFTAQPSLVGIKGNKPLTEMDFLQIIAKEAFRKGHAGNG